jgi:hypothetical protein
MNPPAKQPATAGRHVRQHAHRAAAIPRTVLSAPRWLWPAIETSLAATAIAGATLAARTAWLTVADLGAPWWAGLLALALPCGALARLAKEAPQTITRYRNWRDHTIDSLIERLTPTTDGDHHD